ncbi:mechanosensitive channel; stage V sporulation protein AC [Ruminococcaceae bacterium BL-6]|jgi:stage V sporulation protein AC|nr:mechanosensitive channel; stage V sporulation protein AC [Ruminococcaceae bacterium BL-6]HBC27167.1 stage V sporulation protein AC [Oscillospiraceae bacterium]
MKKITKEEYSKMVEKASPNTSSLKNCIWAFLVGGLICCLGQVFVNLYQQAGLDLKGARAAESISLIGLTAVLTALKIYDNIAKHAGAGTLVPITGFANSMVSPAMEFKPEGFVTGIGAKMFVIAGPVLVYGITSSIVYGLIVYLFHLY